MRHLLLRSSEITNFKNAIGKFAYNFSHVLLLCFLLEIKFYFYYNKRKPILGDKSNIHLVCSLNITKVKVTSWEFLGILLQSSNKLIFFLSYRKKC